MLDPWQKWAGGPTSENPGGDNSMRRFDRYAMVATLAITQMLASVQSYAAEGQRTLQAGTRVYLSLDDMVSSAHGVDDVGTIVRCRVWRDVEDQGYIFIKANAPATCRVDKISRKGIAGQEGKVSVAGVDARSVDGQTINLSGGYHKAGAGSQVAVWTVGLLLFWPALLVTGKTAELPPGTVFDTTTVNDLNVQPPAGADANLAAIDLRGNGSSLGTEFLLDDFIKQPKHETIRIKVARSENFPQELTIDRVNGKDITPVDVTLTDIETKDGATTAVAEVPTKSLIKFFVKGINRFDVSSVEDGKRESSEVIMNVQI
jgi:hypothetical protein